MSTLFNTHTLSYTQKYTPTIQKIQTLNAVKVSEEKLKSERVCRTIQEKYQVRFSTSNDACQGSLLVPQTDYADCNHLPTLHSTPATRLASNAYEYAPFRPSWPVQAQKESV